MKLEKKKSRTFFMQLLVDSIECLSVFNFM